MSFGRRPPAFVTALAWVFGVGAGLTLLFTPALVASGWLTRDLLLRLQSEGLTLPAWYWSLATALFLVLVLIHCSVGAVSLVAARAFWRMRWWAWRWFHGLLMTSLIGLVGLMSLVVILGIVLVPRLNAVVSGGTALPAGLVMASRFGVVTGIGALLLSAVPVVVLLWVLRSAAVRPLFEPREIGGPAA
jgi:hypothetical protein